MYPTQSTNPNDERARLEALELQRSFGAPYGPPSHTQSLPHTYQGHMLSSQAQFDPAYTSFPHQNVSNLDYSPITQSHNSPYGRSLSTHSSLAGAVSDPNSTSPQDYLTMSPEPINATRQTHGMPPTERYPQSGTGPTAFTSGIKRARGDDSDTNDGELDNDHKDKTKTWVLFSIYLYLTVLMKNCSSACLRCRGQKVRCEMRSENESCKRCLNGGHECVIPGPKKRRVPP